MKNTMITGINAIDIAREEILLGTMTPERLSELAAISETPIDEDSVVQDYILENIYPDEEYNEAETLALEQIADVPRYRGFYDKYMVGHCDPKYYATNYSNSDGQEICYYTAHCYSTRGERQLVDGSRYLYGNIAIVNISGWELGEYIKAVEWYQYLSNMLCTIHLSYEEEWQGDIFGYAVFANYQYVGWIADDLSSYLYEDDTYKQYTGYGHDIMWSVYQAACRAQGQSVPRGRINFDRNRIKNAVKMEPKIFACV